MVRLCTYVGAQKAVAEPYCEQAASAVLRRTVQLPSGSLTGDVGTVESSSHIYRGTWVRRSLQMVFATDG